MLIVSVQIIYFLTNLIGQTFVDILHGPDGPCLITGKDYDNLCYIDCDILPTPHAFGRSIFDTEGTAKYTERDEGSRAAWHVNAGVFKVDKIQARKLSFSINNKAWVKMLKERGKNQDAFNECWKKTFMRKPKHFGTSWNATRPYHRMKQYYLHHYIGAQKTERGNQFGNLKSNGVYEWNLKN